MRILLSFLVVPLLTHARVCGPPDASAEVAIEGKAPIGAVVQPAVVPTHGGQIVYADTVPMEVVVQGNGQVQAYPVVTVQGQPPLLPPTANVTVNVPVQGGPPRSTRLTWRRGDAYFGGQVRGAVVVPGPINVVVVDGGRRYATVAPVIVTPVVVQAPSATVVVGGGAVVAGPRAGVYVGAPSVAVVAPTVAVGVGVGVAPAPVYYDDRTYYRGKHHDNGRHNGWYGGHGGGHGRH